MPLPFIFEDKQLSTNDFYRHELQFCRIISELFTCQNVHFAHVPLQENGETTTSKFSEAIKTGIDLAYQQEKPIIDQKGKRAFIPVNYNEGGATIAILSNGPPNLYTNSSSWFAERARQANRECSLIKQWSTDPVSGLLNITHLNQEISLLNSFNKKNIPPNTDETAPHLLLIEVFDRSKDGGQTIANIGQAGAYLDSLLGSSPPLHHLGAGIFGLICPKNNEQEAQKLGYAILRRLKRQDSAKAHIGIAPLYTADPLNNAWLALQASRHRGVFSLCSATTLHPEHQPLPPPSPEVVSQFNKLWRGENQFAIILLHRDLNNQPEKTPARLLTLIGDEATIISINSRELFIYLPGADENEALKWAKKFTKKIANLKIGTYSQGIANYPCPGFKKGNIPFNARKALSHAAFYGQSAITAFDSVSLNISGDIYYNEGDLNNAIREYQLGLNLNPENINLLNSLGVIYAQIESYKKAIPLFERILTIHPHDFMAMFNLGFAYFRSTNQQLALNYFEKAMTVDSNYFDLLLQLGQIYCSIGQYKKAVHVLKKAEANVTARTARKKKSSGDNPPWERCEPWHNSGDDLGHDLIYRYLGEAYKGINKNHNAITYLQKATRFNSRDAKALSLLGELYAIENEGIDIAISLCRQATELNSEHAGHWRRLAFTLLKGNDPQASLQAAKRGLTIAPKEQNTLLLLAKTHKEMGQLPQARTTLERILKIDGTNHVAAKLLKQINKKHI